MNSLYRVRIYFDETDYWADSVAYDDFFIEIDIQAQSTDQAGRIAGGLFMDET